MLFIAKGDSGRATILICHDKNNKKSDNKTPQQKIKFSQNKPGVIFQHVRESGRYKINIKNAQPTPGKILKLLKRRRRPVVIKNNLYIAK